MKAKFQVLILIALLAFSGIAMAGDPVKNNESSSLADITDSSCRVVDNIQSVNSVQGGGDVFASQSVFSVGAGILDRLFLIGSKYSGVGFKENYIPSFNISYEYGINSNWGVGAAFNFSTVTLKASGTIDNNPKVYPFDVGQDYNFNTEYKMTGLQYYLTVAYHISVNDNIDPFVAAIIGYNSISSTLTSNDPNMYYDGKNVAVPKSGILIGGMVGARYYFNGYFGVWADFSSAFTAGSLLNIGISVKF